MVCGVDTHMSIDLNKAIGCYKLFSDKLKKKVKAYSRKNILLINSENLRQSNTFGRNVVKRN